MRLLLDESLPRRLRAYLPGHSVKTVGDMGWRGYKYGRLLTAAAGEFDAFITADKNLPYQQNGGDVTSYLYIHGKKGLQRLVAEIREALFSGACSDTRLDDAEAELKPGDRVILISPESPAPKARCIGFGNVPITTGYDGTLEAVWDWVAAWDAPAIVDLPAHAWSAARNSLVRLSDVEQKRIQGELHAILGPEGALRLQRPPAPFSYYDIRAQRQINDIVKDGKGNVPIPERNVASVKEALAKAHGAGQALPCLFDAAGCFRFSFLVVGAMESVRLQADGHHAVTLRDVQALVPPITRMGMRSFKTKKPVSMSYLHGALLIETPAELLARIGGPTVTSGRP